MDVTFNCIPIEEKELRMLSYTVSIQFRLNLARVYNELREALNRAMLCYSPNTRRPRRVVDNSGRIVLTFRASDFAIIPHIPLAKILKKISPYPKNRVVVASIMVPDIVKSHSVFAKHVIEADELIRIHDEVLVVDEQDTLIGVGRSKMDYDTMITSTYGVAVELREKVCGV